MTMFREQIPILQCPPATAVHPKTLEVYRLCQNNPPYSNDFDSQAKLGTVNIKGFSTELACRAFACSVMTNIESARQIQKMPKLRQHKNIAKLVLEENSGLVLKTKSTHYEWWISAGYDPLGAILEVI